jgi:hypothetical protein
MSTNAQETPIEAPQYWATFSIYDYRTPRFRQALVLFDKVVIPIPDAPIVGSRGAITNEDLKRLSAEVSSLEKQGAAIGVMWNRKEFDAWREEKSGEALAQLLDRDRELATRLQPQESIQKSLAAKQLITGLAYNAAPVMDATVVPVYARIGEYQHSLREERATADVVEVVAGQLPMPDDNEELERIIDLRSRESSKAFMPSFRKWQEKVTLRLLQAGEDEVIRRHEIRLATLELRDAIEQFQRAIADAKFQRLAKGVTLPLVVGSALVGHVEPLLTCVMEHGPELFRIRSLVQPWWRPLLEKECALAGVICEAATR